MILAYETSTNICSVAFQDCDGKFHEKRIQGRSVHSDNMFLFTQQLMQEHDFEIPDLDAVLVSNGPGSYTGLRIAASGIKGLMFGAKVDLYAVNTLATFAMGVNPQKGNIIHSIIDARRTHVYHQSFTFEEGLKEISTAKVIELSELEQLLESEHMLVGTGIDRIDPKALEQITVFDMNSISGISSIQLFHSSNNEQFCIKTSPLDLNSNYISSSQVNNSNG